MLNLRLIDRRGVFELKKLAFILIGIILPVTTVILIFDVILKKYLDLGQPIVYSESVSWGYAPRPNKNYVRFEGSNVSINEIGLRSPLKWSSQGTKVLFLGDSVTYGGSYIDDLETFSHLVCKDLQNFSCFNGGVNGYGVLNMVTRSKYDQRLDNADIVIFTVISYDFLRGLRNELFAHFILREPPRYFSASWELFNFVASLYPPNKFFGKHSDIPKTFEEVNIERMKAASFAIQNLEMEYKRLKSMGKKVLIIHSPNIAEFSKKEPWVESLDKELKSTFGKDYFRLHKTLRDELLKINNGWFDNEQYLDDKGKKMKKIIASSQGIFKDTVHFEKKGHQIVAKAIKEELQKLNYFK